VGLGVQSGFPDPTDPNYRPSSSDFLRIFNDIKRIAVRPSGRWLRYDTALTPDNTWYNCRIYSEQYDVDAESGQLLGTFPGVADTFTIQTTGIYDLAVRERFSALNGGDHGLRITIGGGGSIIAENDVVVVPLHVQTNYCRAAFYLTAGQTIVFQHKYFTSDASPGNMTLYTSIPGPEITIHMLAERDLHS
jgi:hypothetical protein